MNISSEERPHDDEQRYNQKAQEVESINTDGRRAYDWQTKYPQEAIIKIRIDTVYVFIVFIIAFCLSFILATGALGELFKEYEQAYKYLQYALPGLLGGVTFGMKYLYRAIARGYWHRDRRIWRLFSPWVALSVSFAIGVMVDGSLFSPSVGDTVVPYSGAKRVGIGYLAGYFADQAVGKMCDVADVLFGKRAG